MADIVLALLLRMTIQNVFVKNLENNKKRVHAIVVDSLRQNKWTRGAIPAVLLHLSIGSVYAFSLFVKPISEYIGRSEGSTQFAFSLAIFFLGMSAAFGGKLVEKNIHRSSLISLFCFCGGLAFTAFAMWMKSLVLLYLGYGCLLGIGLGLGYVSPVKTLMLWFKDNKGLATGISVCAFGFASSVASPIITFLLNSVSLPATFLIMSAIYITPMFVAHLLLRKPNGWVEPSDDSGFRIMSMWKDSKFRAIWLIVFSNITCGLALISTASPILAEIDVSAKSIAIVVSVMGAFNGAGRLLFSAASDKMQCRINIYMIIAIISAFVTLINVKQGVITTSICLIVVSACYGAGFSCLPTLLSDIYGMRNISQIHSLSLTAWSIAGLVGNQISNLVHNITGNYQVLFYVIALIYTVELCIIIWLSRCKLK